MQIIKSNLLKFSAVFLIVLALVPAAKVAAADSVDIQGATCAGSDIIITSDPSKNACDNVDKQESAKTANHLVSTIVNIMTVVVGILAVIMIIYAGFRYVTSGGSDDAVKGAKNTIIYAIIGLVVVALAQIIVHFVINKTAQASFPCKNHKVQGGPDNNAAC